MSAVCAASAVMVTRAVAAKTTKNMRAASLSTRARGRASVATRAVELATGETLEVKPVPMRVGHGFDLHRMETLAEMPDLELWLGGIKLEHDRGCVAHSDGDVLLTASSTPSPAPSAYRTSVNASPITTRSGKGARATCSSKRRCV